MANKYKQQQLKIQPLTYIFLAVIVAIVALLVIFSIPKGSVSIAKDYNVALQGFEAQDGYLQRDNLYSRISLDSFISKVKKGENVLAVFGGVYSQATCQNLGKFNDIFDSSLDPTNEHNKELVLSNKLKHIYLVEFKNEEAFVEGIEKINEKLADIPNYKKVSTRDQVSPIMLSFVDGKYIDSLHKSKGNTLVLQLKNLYLSTFNAIKALDDK
jgi:hypothetical protein